MRLHSDKKLKNSGAKPYAYAEEVLPAALVTAVQQHMRGAYYDVTFRAGGPVVGREARLPPGLALRCRVALQTVVTGPRRVYFRQDASLVPEKRGAALGTSGVTILARSIVATGRHSRLAVADALGVSLATVNRATAYLPGSLNRGCPSPISEKEIGRAGISAVWDGLRALARRYKVKHILPESLEDAVLLLSHLTGTPKNEIERRARYAGMVIIDLHGPVGGAA